jgi:hypothetical protein
MQMLLAAQQPKPLDEQALQIKIQQEIAKVQQIQSQAILNQAKAAEISAPSPDGSPQVDTPADLAKAALDIAKADEIRARIAAPAEQPGGMFDLEEQAAKVRREHAQAEETEARASRARVETSNLARYGTVEPAKIRPDRPQGARGQ